MSQNVFYRLEAQFPHQYKCAVSAKSECRLQQLQKSGLIQYNYGSVDIQPCEQLTEDVITDLENIRNVVLDRYFDSTGYPMLIESKFYFSKCELPQLSQLVVGTFMAIHSFRNTTFVL